MMKKGNRIRLRAGISLLLALFLLSLSACKKVQEGKPSNGGGEDGPTGEITISGTVRSSNGTPLAGVVVSDGFKSYKSAADGSYRIDSDLSKAKFVSASIPDGYKASVENGIPAFFKRLSDEGKVNGKYQRLDFTFTPGASSWTMLIAADVQPRAKTEDWDKFAYHSLDVAQDFYAEVSAYAKTLSGNVCGVMLGDIVHEDMSLYAQYKTGLKKMGIPFFNVIGNHDNNLNKADDVAGAEDFEKNLGPTNYSFNMGGFHVIVLDNIIMKSVSGRLNKKYDEGLTDDIWNWLQGDLRYVSYSTPLIVCSHAPLIASNGGSARYTKAAHGNDYAALLAKYKRAYSFSGHTHQAYNSNGSTVAYKNLETHIVTRCCGPMWDNEWVNSDGLPRGYVVATLSGGNIRWQYRATRVETAATVRPASSRPAYARKVITDNVRAYARGAYGDSYVYADVFLWDESWGAVKFVAPGKTTNMTRVTSTNLTYDCAWKEIYDFYKANIDEYKSDSTYPFDSSNHHIFRVYSSDSSGSGYVEVTDRFGNTYRSNTITW